jgi:hypothetical protein
VDLGSWGYVVNAPEPSTWQGGAKLSDVRSFTGRAMVSVLLERTFRFDGEKLEAADEAPAMDPQREQYLREQPYACLRPYTDVCVLGTVRRERPVTSAMTRVEVGTVRRAVRLIGNRTARRSRKGCLEVTSPEPFEEMRADLEHAFGGTSPSLHRRGGVEAVTHEAYQRNPLGKGYLAPGVDFAGDLALPNTEDESYPFSVEELFSAESWFELPRPAHYGLEFVESFPRVASLLPFELPTGVAHRVTEVRQGLLGASQLVVGAEVPSPVVSQAACLELATTRLPPGTPFRLEGFGGERWTVGGRLPVQRPIFCLTLPGARRRELESRIAGVYLEPLSRRVTLTWAAAQPVLGPYGDALDEADVRVQWR